MKGKAASLSSAVGLFFSLTFGGMILGLIFGALSTLWIKKIFNDEILVVNITFLTCYIVNCMEKFFKKINFFWDRCSISRKT